MTLEQAMNELELTDLTGCSDAAREVTGIYVGDLLSHVMSHAQEGQLWITVQVNINIVAVAVLCEVAAIIVPEEIPVSEPVLAKAREENVAVLSCKESAYELIVRYSRLS